MGYKGVRLTMMCSSLLMQSVDREGMVSMRSFTWLFKLVLWLALCQLLGMIRRVHLCTL